MSTRVPTLKQYGQLRCVANPGCELVGGTTGPCRRTWQQLIHRGWVAPARDVGVENGLRITPLGLRALAAALETHGYPS